MSRRDARKHAFTLIFQIPFYKPENAEAYTQARILYYEGLPEEDRPTGRDAAYVQRVSEGIYNRLSEIDDVIESCLTDWHIDRINKVDLALLRVGMYELLFMQDIPPGAAINEAVELAKQYGTDESPAFVNGVLGIISRLEKIGVTKDE